MGEGETPWLLQKEKRRSVKSDVSEVLFPDIGKITCIRFSSLNENLSVASFFTPLNGSTKTKSLMVRDIGKLVY